MMTAPLNIFIVDDEAPARARLRRLLEDCRAAFPNQVVGEAGLAHAALAAPALSMADVVLLDIEMPGMDGLGCARELMKRKPAPTVIFTTSHADYALKAFDVAASDYLLKPVRLQRLVESLSRVQRRLPMAEHALAGLEQPMRHFNINDKGRVLKVPVEKALYLRAELKYVTLRTREREFVLSDSLGQLEEKQAHDFLRIHRNCLVNRRHLLGFEAQHLEGESRWFAVLHDWPERLLVSRRQTHLVKLFRGDEGPIPAANSRAIGNQST